jgi:hypothetical protein
MAIALSILYLHTFCYLDQRSDIFGRQSANAKKRHFGTPYQRQTAMEILVFGLSMNACDSVLACLMLNTAVLFALSSINRIKTVMQDELDGEEVSKIRFISFFFTIPWNGTVSFILR